MLQKHVLGQGIVHMPLVRVGQDLSEGGRGADGASYTRVWPGSIRQQDQDWESVMGEDRAEEEHFAWIEREDRAEGATRLDLDRGIRYPHTAWYRYLEGCPFHLERWMQLTERTHRKDAYTYLEGLLDSSKGSRVSSLVRVVAPGGLAVRGPAHA